MERQKDWNPDLYLKYKNQRTQPAIDLVGKINIDYSPQNILDVGCGPGNSSRILLQRWPDSRLVGIDNSPAMIEKARADYPDQEWLLAEAATFKSGEKFDVIFSNAAIQWMPNHAGLLNGFFNLLAARGVLAVQLPMFQDMPLARAIAKVAGEKRWQALTAGCNDLFTFHDYRFYYDNLADKFSLVDIWETHYAHIMDSRAAIIEWIRSTGLKPYLERLESENDKLAFEKAVLNEITDAYPNQKNGKVLFPFKRLFFVGYKIANRKTT